MPTPAQLHKAAAVQAVNTPCVGTLPPSRQYADLCLAIVGAVTRSATVADGLSLVFGLLRDAIGACAMALETTSEAATRFQPYGDLSSLMQEPGGCGSGVSLLTVELNPVGGVAGRLLLAVPAGTEAAGRPGEPTPLLETLALLVGQRLAQEALARRAEEADRRAEQKMSEVAAIYEIGLAIDKIEHSRLLKLITERAASLMGAQACSLMVVHEETDSLRVAASTGLSDLAVMQEQRIGEGIAGRVALTEQPMLIVGDLHDPRLEGVRLRPEISSSMLVPMKNPEGRVLGVLAIRRTSPARDFDELDLKVFSVFATQAARALSNKRLYDDLNQRAAELLKISSLSRALISTLDLDELLRRVAEDICGIVGFQRCCLFLRDPGRPVYSPRTWRGYSDATLKNPAHEGEGAVGLAARSKQIVRFEPNEAQPDEPEELRSYRQRKGFARSLGVSAFVAVPLLDSKNRCLGVVVADNKGSRRPISPGQTSLLSAFVNQAGIAIENARLYDTTQENLQNIHRLNSETENVLQSIGACILCTDARGVVTRWNRATETTLGLSSAMLRGALLTEVIRKFGLPKQERVALLDLVGYVQETGDRQYRAKWTLHPAERPAMTIDLHLARLLDYHQERAGVVLTFEDVTKEVQMEAEIDRMRRLADIGQLAAKMAHEVRNALSPIKGAAQIVRLDLQTQNVATEWPDIIISEVDGLSRLTSEMLDFARPMSLDIHEISLEELLTGSVHALAPFMAEHRVSVKCEIAPDLPRLFADPMQLGQVVRNIAMNAAQSMPEGGALTVSAQRDADSTFAVVRFQDTGIGIRADDVERVFRPFVTTRTKGTGLGLPIVQKIVNQHGGRVEVASTLGEGTCFSVFLPLGLLPDTIDRHSQGEPLITAQPIAPYPDN